ncbi:Ig-like domain-containing protein [Brucella anthropi]|uniref:Ig-like domain-containing protein n=2 Tax=Brucella anthropi TaxID=529 RepID=UPI00244CC395|nr:Ig-like domain-containing protein [Brucella anthropi]MDG9793672.1 Ig-like domain-containing protein [Brucella anthropi]MDH0820075.1 Ig-like domain-containing protein [Brucella anthropi]MDH2086917.1 Ig-like domain-containing protein [Brucella anthropi]
MKAVVFPKAESGASRNFDGNRIRLETPSVVQLQIGPEEVARFERDGNNLLLILEDGSVVVIENFFVTNGDARNDLVFEDGNDVTWWAQYGETWSGFDIAEINSTTTAAPLPMALLAGIGLAAGGAAIAIGSGGGSDDGPSNRAPVVSADPVETAEDNVFKGVITAKDADGDTLTFELSGEGPKHGTVTVNPDGTYTYTPHADHNGPDSFDVVVSDGRGGKTIVTVPITVTPVVDIAPDEAVTHAGEPVTTAVLSNDTFKDPDARISAVTPGAHGSVVVNPDGTITYTPKPGFVGTDTYTYTVLSGGTEETTTVTVTVNNQPPVTEPESVIAPEDTPVTGNLLGNDSDPDGDAISITRFEINGSTYLPGEKVSIPDIGVLVIKADGSYSFEPVANWNGKVPTVTYTVSDGNDGGSTTSTLDIEITPVDDLPETVGTIVDQANNDADAITSLDVSGFFKDVDGDTLTYSATGLPKGLTIDPNTGIISGTIDPSASQDGVGGAHSVTITVSDGTSTVDQTFTWTVSNPAPVANDDAVSTDEDTPVSGNVLLDSAAGDVADTDPDGDTLVVTKFEIAGTSYNAGEQATIAGVGTFTLNSDGAYTFTPDENWNGTVPTITYTISDGEGGTDTANLTITVDPVNDLPETVGTIDDQANNDADAITSLDVSDFFKDVDGDTLTYSATGLPKGLTLDPNTGIISGTIDPSASQDGVNGAHSVTITASDGSSTAEQTFTWTVSNPPPVANDDAVSTDEDTPVSGNVLLDSPAGDVADSDPDGDELVVTKFVIEGTTYDAGDSATIAGVGTFTLDSTGAYTFTPDKDWNGTVPTITYTISDGEGGTDTANLTITVDPVNDAPEIVGTIVDQANNDADAITSLDVSGFFNDVDGDTLTYSATGLPKGLTLDPNTGIISGTIDPSASQDGVNGAHSVTITASDGSSTAEQTFTWTVSNPPPIANDDAVSTDEDTPVSGNVLLDSPAGDVADSDPDGDELVVTKFVIEGTTYDAGDSATIAGVGTFTLDSTGAYTFTPDKDWNGTVPTITYTISDGEGGTDTANLTITVDPVNDAPVIAGGDQAGSVVEAGHLDDGTLNPGNPIATGSFAASDVDGDTLSWSVLGTPDQTYGTFAIDAATGAWSYTLDNSLSATQALNEGDEVELSFDVQVSDGQGGTETRTVVITINGTNDAPVANADTGSVSEAGVQDGGNDPISGTATATGNVLTNDTDVDDGEKTTLAVNEVKFGDVVGTVGSSIQGTYGTLTLNSDGSYTYELDNTSTKTQSLKQSEQVTETFTYTAVDVNGATSSSTLTITVTGANDRPEITSDAQAASGEVTEQGTANPDQNNVVSGTLTASDVDKDATLTWSVVSTNGTYGTIGIDATTGQWTYTLDNTRAATQALNDGEKGTETFTALVTDEHGASREQVITVTVNGSNDDITGLGNQTISVLEDGVVNGSLQDFVSDVDNKIILTGFSVDADGDGIDEMYTAGQTVELKNGTDVLGTLFITEDGKYSFTPAQNYGGNVPTVTYTMAESGGGKSVTQTLGFTITKVADAPEFEANKNLNTDEDTAVSLGLKTPVITDTGTGTTNNDYPERIGEITLTISGAGADGVTLSTGGKTLTPVDGKITIVLSDVPLVSDVPAADDARGIYYLTSAEYAALVANPRAESGNNFTVTVSATSYEVDASGGKIAGVAGASSTQVINVDVQAVTDGAELKSDVSTLTFAEDSKIDLSSHLTAALTSTDANAGNDTDGSERYSYTISGLPAGSIVSINGTNYTVGANGSVTSPETSTFSTAPNISITPPRDFSGDISAVKITLNTRDTDSDSAGIPATVESSVTIALRVTPVAGDVTATDSTTAEDTAVHFLAGVAVTDTGTAAGSEVINEVSFEVPTSWTVWKPDASAGWSYNISGTTATITFDGSLSQTDREAILDAFTITPPAHSSLDATIKLSITSTDTNGSDSDTKTVDRDVKITVTPVAERTDSDSDGNGQNDVTMNGDHAYSVAGQEDAWFALGSNYTGSSNTSGGFDGLTPWSNADSDEFTYAVLTPTLSSDTPTDTVIGTEFRYSTDGGTTWQTQTYVSEPIWVPSIYLNTLQVKLPADVSGTLTIGVQAATVDYDDDRDVSTLPLDPPHESGDGVNVAISGEATLSLIKFEPVADEVTMALNGRATGLEDTAIPLSIKTTSSDDSETFNVTISGIPNGAVITYNGEKLTVSGGAVTIVGFNNSYPMTVTPPLNSNNDFKLTVSAVSVDGTSTSAPVSRTIDIAVTGVADNAVITLPNVAYTTTEAALDAGAHKVQLSNIITSVASSDTDGSEVTTLRITGLSENFSLTGATMVVSGTGTERIWMVSASDLSKVSIVVPENFSGTVNLKVAGVTTENDGDSRTGPLTDVSFTVTPSPEALITSSATLVEDEISPLNLGIIPQNGDTDEKLGSIFIPVNYDASKFTLYVGGTEISAADLQTKEIEGKTYYIVPSDQIDSLGAKGAANLDGDLGKLDFLYEVIDPSTDGTLTAVTEVKNGSLTIDALPVTDAVDASITAITMTSATGTTSDEVAGDDAEPDKATVTTSGTVTVNLHVNSADTDGSEHLVRVVIEGVPDGVTVNGASQIGAGSWLLIYSGADAKSIGIGGINLPVEFVVGKGASNLTSTITMTVLAQDEGQNVTSPAKIETDSVKWNLTVDLGDGQSYLPPVIDEWSYNGAQGTEETEFTLDGVIDAKVTTSDSSVAYSYTVTLTNLALGTTVDGMTFTTINGVPTWSATVVVPVGGDSQAALDGLLAGIKITPPLNSNENNADFNFDAKLTAAAVGGTSTEEVTKPDMPIIPVTDEATVTIDVSDVAEGKTSVTATISAFDVADGTFGTIVDGKLYVQVSTNGNDNGTLTDGEGRTLTLTDISGVVGVPDGKYYVVEIGTAGGSVELTYTAADGTVLQPGDVTFNAWVQTKETGAANTEAASASSTAEVLIVNNGVTVESQPVTGKESGTSEKTNAIKLTGLTVALKDNDGSEAIKSILLSGVPVGFLLYVGSSAGDATVAFQASNAGGDGSTNTWVISSDGTMPAYVAILPAPHWSGTLTDLSLVVESGEASLPTTRVDTVPLAPVTVEAVADGIAIDPTLSFGKEGRIISLNLNAAMVDAGTAVAGVEDASTETTTLKLTGLGAHAAFYIGGELIDENNATISIVYDQLTNSYTIAGLSQDDLYKLGVVQAASALSDQDPSTAGTQIGVEAWTVESATGAESAHVTDTLTLAVTPTTATTGNDTFIWSGSNINGRAGSDTVALRYGEDLSGDDLKQHLKNIEIIDLGIHGTNAITDLTPDDVQAITDANHTLTIKGTSEDTLSLSGNWVLQSDGSYTGTGDNGTTVTLKIDGVAIEGHEDAVASSSDHSSLFSFALAEETESFGLSSIDTQTATTPVVEQQAALSIDDVLSSATGHDSISAILPDEHKAKPFSSDVGGGASDFVDVSTPMTAPSLEDELRSAVHYEA